MGDEQHQTEHSAVLSAVRWCVGVLGAAAVLGSVLAMAAPATLYAVDRSGQRITCGTALEPVYETAAREDAVNQRLHNTRGPLFQQTSYTDDCAALISERRSVGMPAAVLGAVAVVAVLAVSARRPVQAVVRAVRHDAPTDPAAAPSEMADEAAVIDEAVKAINRRAVGRTSLPQT